MKKILTPEENYANANKIMAELIEVLDETVRGLLFEDKVNPPLPYAKLEAYREEGEPPGVFLSHDTSVIPLSIAVGGHVEELEGVDAVNHYRAQVSALYMNKLVRELEPEGGPPWKRYEEQEKRLKKIAEQVRLGEQEKFGESTGVGI